MEIQKSFPSYSKAWLSGQYHCQIFQTGPPMYTKRYYLLYDRYSGAGSLRPPIN